MNSTKQKRGSSTIVPETPDEGRSRRQSTMLVSAATRSVLLQSASPKRGQYVEDTPDQTVNFKGSKIVTETPDDMDETVFDTSQIPESVGRKPKSILKTKHGPTKVRNLPTILPGEETFVAQSQRAALSSTVMESSGGGSVTDTPPTGSGKKRGRKPKVSSGESLDISGIGPLTPEVRSAKKSEDKRRGRRSNVSREQFLSFVFQKEASPPPAESIKEPTPKKDKYDFDQDSDSSDDGWEALKNSDGSIKKFLPKADNMRKSVVISGNIKSRTKNQLSVPKAQRNKKVNKNLSDELSRKSVVNDTVESETSPSKKGYKNFTLLDESNITTSRRKSRHRTIIEEQGVSPNKPDASKLLQSSSGNGSQSINGLSMNSENFERTKLPLSFQNFSTDSAKAMIAAMEKQVEAANADTNKSGKEGNSLSNESIESPKKGRGRPKKSSLFTANFDVIDTPLGRKRKNEESPSVDTKKAKSDHKVATDSPMEIASSVVKVKKPFHPLQKGGEKTSLTPQPMEMDSPSPIRRSGRDSTRIATIATTNALKSPVMFRQPTDPIIQNIVEQSPGFCAPTQKAPILEGVVVFVDFRAANENRGNVIKNAARDLGAAIADKLGPDVTHVIFKDGSRINYQKAKKSGLPILSAGWLEESKKEGKKMPESQYPSVSIEKYDSPGLFPKMKKMKSMQPKTLDEDFEAASKAQDRKQKMLDKKLLKEQEAEKLKNPVTNIKYPPHEHYYKGSPHNSSRTRKAKSNTDSSLKEVLQEFRTPTGTPVKMHKNSLPNLLSPGSPSDGDFDTPLARRLANRYQSPLLSRNIASTCSSPDRSSGNQNYQKSLPTTPTRNKEADTSSLMTSNLDTTLKPRKGNSKTNNSLKEIPELIVEKGTPSKLIDNTTSVDETIEESPVMRRSRRSTTAISTLATSQAVAQEINKRDIEAGQDLHTKGVDIAAKPVEDSPDYKELLPSPVVSKRGRGRPKKTVEDPGGSTNSTFGNPQLESTRVAPRHLTLSKTSVGEPQLESTRLVSKSFKSPTPSKQISPVIKPKRTPTAAENDLMFDALLSGKPSPSPPKIVEKPKKFVLSSTKKITSTVTQGITAQKELTETPHSTETPQSSLNKTPRIVAPWRHLAELDKPEKAATEAVTDDVCEFSGFPDDPPSKKKEPAPVLTRRKSREVQKTRDTSYGRPSRVKMFMVAPHGAYSGYAAGIKRKLEQSPSKSQSQSPLRSPMRSPMRSPLRAGLGSPRGETSQARSPRFGVGSPRASPSHRIGSPRVDPSQRIGSPRVERVNPYSSPTNRIGGSPHRVGGSPKAHASPKTTHGILLVDVPSDKPGISLTGFASDYNIVEAVGKHHAPSAAVGKPPVKTVENGDPNKPPAENGQVSTLDVGIAASKATVVHNPDGTVSVVPKDISKEPAANGSTDNQADQVNTSKKSLLSKIFSKPPSKDTKEDEIDNKKKPEEKNDLDIKKKSEEKNDSKSIKNKRKLFPSKNSLVLDQTADPNSLATTDNIENVHCDEPVRRKRSKTVIRKNSGELFAEPPAPKSTEEPFRKPSRKASKKIMSFKETSSDSESIDSNASEDLSSIIQPTQPEKPDKKVGRKKVKKMAPPRRSSFDFEPLPNFLKKKEDRDNLQDESSSGRSRRGKGTRGATPTPVSNIVCTSCHKDDINLVKQLVKMFGLFSFSTSVTSSTSHVVSGEGKRTLNLLKGLLQGCWIVTKEWVLSSLEEGKWVDEEPYEMVDFSPAVRNLRQEKGAFQGAFKSELFKDVGTVYISNNCRAPKEELKQLISSGGGTVANVTRIASVVVGEARAEEDADCVTEKWILDSVQFHVIMPFSDYPIE